jgi:putative inorganic carbon (HCO3(-)) transporter
MGVALALVYIALNLLSPGDMIPVLAPFRPMVFLALAILPLAVLGRLQSPEIGKLRTQTALVALFFAFAACSWLPHGWLGGNLMTVINLAPNVLVYFLGIVLLRTPVRLRFLRTTLVLVAVFVMFNAFMELPSARSTGISTPYVIAGGLPPLSSEAARIRGLGVLHDPNVFGQYLLMLLPILFVGKRDSGLGVGYAFAIPVALLLTVGVYFTGSRGAEVGMAVLLGLYLFWRFKALGGIVSAVGGTLLLAVVNATRSRTITMQGGLDRLAIWSEGMQYFKHQPLWGIGYGGFMEREGMTAHNSYLLCAAELGMIGYFLWMSMIVVTLIQLNRVPKVVGKSDPVLARWALALRLSLSVYMFTSFFLSRVYELPIFLLLGMSGAIIAAAGGDDAIPLRGTGWPVRSFVLCVGILVLIWIMLRLRVV